jgi:predicted nucleic acid-binding protein
MITLDASAAIKLVIDENGSDIARKLFNEVTASGEPILAPDIMLSESVNGLWKHLVLLKDITEVEFQTAINNLVLIWDNLIVIRTEEMLGDSARISKDKKMPFYDAFYVAICLSKDIPLFTFDQPIIDRSVELGLAILQ